MQRSACVHAAWGPAEPPRALWPETRADRARCLYAPLEPDACYAGCNCDGQLGSYDTCEAFCSEDNEEEWIFHSSFGGDDDTPVGDLVDGENGPEFNKCFEGCMRRGVCSFSGGPTSSASSSISVSGSTSPSWTGSPSATPSLLRASVILSVALDLEAKIVSADDVKKIKRSWTEEVASALECDLERIMVLEITVKNKRTYISFLLDNDINSDITGVTLSALFAFHATNPGSFLYTDPEQYHLASKMIPTLVTAANQEGDALTVQDVIDMAVEAGATMPTGPLKASSHRTQPHMWTMTVLAIGLALFR